MILHPYRPGHRTADQAACIARLDEAERLGFAVEHIRLTGRPFGYATALVARWERWDDWTLIEHDIEPSIDLLYSLGQCPEPLCTRPYAVRPSDGPFIEWAERHKPSTSVAGFFGATRISAAARRALPLDRLPVAEWWHLDSVVTVALANAVGKPWHLHYEPLAHHHDSA